MTASNWALIEDDTVVDVLWADKAFIDELPNGSDYVEVPENVGANVGVRYTKSAGFEVTVYEYGDEESNAEFERRLAEFERRKK